MTLLLRLAVLLHRGRSSVALPEIKLTPRADSLEMRFPPGWLDDHPLTVADLQHRDRKPEDASASGCACSAAK